MHSLSQSHRIDADVDMTTLVHQLEMGGALYPRGSTCERQVYSCKEMRSEFSVMDIKRRRVALKTGKHMSTTRESKPKNPAVTVSLNSTCVLWEDWFNSYSMICECKKLGWVPEVDAFLCSHTNREAKVACG